MHGFNLEFICRAIESLLPVVAPLGNQYFNQWLHHWDNTRTKHTKNLIQVSQNTVQNTIYLFRINIIHKKNIYSIIGFFSTKDI